MFSSWASLHPFCRVCGLKFEREPGYWAGALIINMAAALAVFFAVLIGGMVLTWPEVPWTGLTIAIFVSMAIVPIGFYPWSKSIWLAIEMSYHKLEDHERIEAAGRVDP